MFEVFEATNIFLRRRRRRRRHFSPYSFLARARKHRSFVRRLVVCLLNEVCAVKRRILNAGNFTQITRRQRVILKYDLYVYFKMMIPNDEIKSNHPRRLTTHHWAFFSSLSATTSSSNCLSEGYRRIVPRRGERVLVSGFARIGQIFQQLFFSRIWKGWVDVVVSLAGV